MDRADRTRVRSGRVEASPRFDPWVGDDARGTAGGVRWHVLGESHYSRPEDGGYEEHPGTTQEVVRDWALSKSAGSAFFTRVASMIANRPADSFDRAAVWQQFAFSNYIQRHLDAPRKAPPEQWQDEAANCFFGQLAITQPEVLVVLGSRLWEMLPADVGIKAPEFAFEVEPDWPSITDAWLYPHQPDGEPLLTIAVKVVHPSAGFGHWNWHTAASRVQTAAYCASNIAEWFMEHCCVEEWQ